MYLIIGKRLGGKMRAEGSPQLPLSPPAITGSSPESNN